MIDVDYPDKAYDLCSGFNEFSCDSGKKIVQEFEGLISGLLANWISKDASLHIGNLIDLYSSLVASVNYANSISATAGNAMKSVHSLSIANGVGGSAKDELIVALLEDKGYAKPNLEETRYFVDPTATPRLLQQLGTIKGNFPSFCTVFDSFVDDLKKLWHDGLDRDNVFRQLEEFSSALGNYQSAVNSAYSSLDQAVSNISKVANN